MTDSKVYCERKSSLAAARDVKSTTETELAKLHQHIQDTGAGVFAPHSESDDANDSSGSKEKVITTKRYIQHAPKGDSTTALLELIANLQLDARRDMDEKFKLKK